MHSPRCHEHVTFLGNIAVFQFVGATVRHVVNGEHFGILAGVGHHVKNQLNSHCDAEWNPNLCRVYESRRSAWVRICVPSINGHTWLPRYCSHGHGTPWFTNGKADVTHGGITHLCNASVEVGKVAGVVIVYRRHPDANVCQLAAHTSSVFDQVPSISELLERLTVTTGPSPAVCTASCSMLSLGTAPLAMCSTKKSRAEFNGWGVPHSSDTLPTYLMEFLQEGRQSSPRCARSYRVFDMFVPPFQNSSCFLRLSGSSWCHRALSVPIQQFAQ